MVTIDTLLNNTRDSLISEHDDNSDGLLDVGGNAGEGDEVNANGIADTVILYLEANATDLGEIVDKDALTEELVIAFENGAADNDGDGSVAASNEIKAALRPILTVDVFANGGQNKPFILEGGVDDIELSAIDALFEGKEEDETIWVEIGGTKYEIVNTETAYHFFEGTTDDDADHVIQKDNSDDVPVDEEGGTVMNVPIEDIPAGTSLDIEYDPGLPAESLYDATSMTEIVYQLDKVDGENDSVTDGTYLNALTLEEKTQLAKNLKAIMLGDPNHALTISSDAEIIAYVNAITAADSSQTLQEWFDTINLEEGVKSNVLEGQEIAYAIDGEASVTFAGKDDPDDVLQTELADANINWAEEDATSGNKRGTIQIGDELYMLQYKNDQYSYYYEDEDEYGYFLFPS